MEESLKPAIHAGNKSVASGFGIMNGTEGSGLKQREGKQWEESNGDFLDN